jgi:hypothetical protein
MRTVLMGGVIPRRVHLVVMALRHRTGGHRRYRPVEVTQDERHMSIDGCQHEPRRNQPAQEQKPEDEQRGPAWFLDVSHPSHRCADSGTRLKTCKAA